MVPTLKQTALYAAADACACMAKLAETADISKAQHLACTKLKHTWVTQNPVGSSLDMQELHAIQTRVANIPKTNLHALQTEYHAATDFYIYYHALGLILLVIKSKLAEQKHLSSS